MYKAITLLTLIAASSAQFLPNGCPTDLSARLLPHDSDCAKFYSCLHGEKTEMSCLPGTLFDANLQACAVIAEGGCTLGSNTGTTPASDDTTTPPTTTTESPQTTPAPICPPYGFGNVPHPERCDAFYFCVGALGGQGVLINCSHGFEFDPETRSCVAIAEGGCTLGSNTGTTPASDDTTTPPTTTTESPQTTPAPICPPYGFGNVPHPERCDAFYFCVGALGGQGVLINCSHGFEFDPETRSCVAIAEGGCTLGSNTGTTPASDDTTTPPTTTTESPQTTPAPICPPYGFGNVPHPERCDAFYFCVGALGGQGVLINCSHGFEFDPETRSCVAIAEGGCTLGSNTGTTPASDDTTTPPTTTTESPQTTPAPICPPYGFGNVPHPERCDAFYFCVGALGGQGVLINCSHGFEFDPETRSCVAIAEGGCTLGSNTGTTPASDDTTTPPTTTTESPQTTPAPICPPYGFGNVPHPERCDAFYFCEGALGGQGVLINCSHGFEFDTETRTCVTIVEGGCTLGSNTGTTLAGDDTTTPPTTTTESPQTTPASICPPGFIGNIPHPERCDAFYLCAEHQGILILLRCSHGFEFDPETGSCVAIAEGGCTLGSNTGTTLAGDDTTTPPTTTTESPQTTPASICPPGFIGNIPHPERCDAFYLCAEHQGILILLRCSHGFEFDPETGSCVAIAEGGCTLGSNTGTTLAGDDTTTPPTTTTESPQTTPASICPPGFIGNIPHPERCDAFYLCAEHQGILILLRCSHGFEFDPETGSCVAIAEGGCTLGSNTGTTLAGDDITTPPTTTTESPQTTPAPICPPGVLGNIPHPERCDAFYMCVGNQGILLNCCHGFEFDPETRTCVTIAEGGCTLGSNTGTTPAGDDTTTPPTTTTESPQTTPASICQPGFFGNIPHPERCDDFYMCAGGQAFLLNCSHGFEFDPETRDCVAISEGGCTLGSNTGTTPDHDETTTPSTTTTETPETTPAAVVTTSAPESGEVTIPGTVVTTSAPESGEVTTPAAPVCPPGVFGNIPHPTQCDAFYICLTGGEVLIRCADGFEFDPASLSCVAIAEGGCTLASNTGTTLAGDDTTTPPTTTTESPQTTPAPICPPGVLGNIPHPERCDAFYMCVENQGILLNCAYGFEFDPETRTCVTIAEGGCTLGSNTGITPAGDDTTTPPTMTTESPQTTPAPICPPGLFGNIPHPERCDDFYMCAGGQAFLLNCSHGFEFDPETRSCVAIAEGGCTLGSNTGTTLAGDDTTTPPTTTTESPQTTPAPICPPGVFGNIPHPERCDAWYMCVENQGILLYCAYGFEFDPEIRTCVTIAEGGCTLGSNTGTTPASDDTTTPPTTTKESPQTTPASICPPGFIGNIPHPERCDAFYLCTGHQEILVLLECSHGFEFDPETRTCVTIAEGGCTLGSNTGITPAGDDTTTPPTMTTESPQTTPAPICPPGLFGNIPHPERCDDFYMCAEGQAFLLNCSHGFEFDPETRSCVAIAEGGCTLGSNTGTTLAGDDTTTPPTTTTESPQTTPAPICPPGVLGNIPHPERCDAFYMCLRNEGILLNCIYGFEFDPETRTCVTIAEGGCTLGSNTGTTLAGDDTTTPPTTTTESPQTTPASICPPGLFGNIPHPERCGSFYLCVGDLELLILLECSEGFEFDPETRTCVTIAEGGCTLGSNTGITPAGDDTTTPPTMTTESPQTTLAPICPPGLFGNIPHSERCDDFYMCAGGQAFLLNCSHGFEFDPETRSCVAIAEGGCTLGSNTGTTLAGDDTTTPPTTTSESPQTTPAPICPPGVFGNIPHPERCDALYMCVENQGILLYCAYGFEFDPETRTCVTIAEGGCTLGSNTGTTPAGDDTTTPPTTTTESPQTTPASICPPRFTGNIPHPERCDAFYFCGANQAYLIYCSHGFEFDPETRNCEPITEGGCTLNGTPGDDIEDFSISSGSGDTIPDPNSRNLEIPQYRNLGTRVPILV